jgi:hypothetical protein
MTASTKQHNESMNDIIYTFCDDTTGCYFWIIGLFERPSYSMWDLFLSLLFFLLLGYGGVWSCTRDENSEAKNF